MNKPQEDYKGILLQLQTLYESVPPTQCLETSCADWCCSRLPAAVNEQGHFISLPLIYSIEFLNIQNYVLNNLPQEQIDEFYDYTNKKPLCCFKDRNSPGCLVYPVRPFTCRVFGRRVPPVFFGIEYPPEAVDNIFCANCRIVDPEKEKKFQDRFPLFWDQLASLSAQVSVFTPEQRKALHDVSNREDIYITGWKEFALLSRATPEWLRKNFADFWQIHGNLL